MRFVAVATVVGAVVLSACTAHALPYPPTLVIPLPENEWGRFQFDVYDDTGLVVSGEAGDQTLGGHEPAGVTAIPESNQIVINWTGGACGHRPFANLRGNAAALDITIAPDPLEIGLAPVSCPAVGIISSATLTLSEPVAQENITVTEER